jgi:hypothetical protein
MAATAMGAMLVGAELAAQIMSHETGTWTLTTSPNIPGTLTANQLATNGTGAGCVGLKSISPGTGMTQLCALATSFNTSTTYSFPSAPGTAGQALTTDGIGALSWKTPSPPPPACSLAGDVTGSCSANTVGGIRGVPVSATAPTANQILQYNGTQWAPANLSSGGNGLLALGTITVNANSLTGVHNFATALPSGSGCWIWPTFPPSTLPGPWPYSTPANPTTSLTVNLDSTNSSPVTFGFACAGPAFN